MANLNINTSNAIAELKALIVEVNKLKQSTANVNKANAASFNKLESGLNSLQKSAGLTANKFKYLEAIIVKQNTSIASLTAQVNKNTTANNKNATSTTKQAKNTKTLTSNMGQLLAAFGLIAGVQLFANIIKNSYELIKTFDGLGFALEKITKNVYDLAESNIFLTDITKDYGVELIATTERWVKFLAAAKQSGLTLLDTQKIFGTMTKASGVLGLKTDELRSVYLALEQMLSKGKITTEELRRQLGERLPGAMGIMAASMGVTIAELDKMMKKGEVLSAEVLPGFADAVEIAFGLETVDKIDTIIAKENRMITAWQSLIKNISEGDGVIKYVLGGFIDLLGGALERLDWLLMSSDQKFAIEVGKMMKTLEQNQDTQTKSIINAKAKWGERYSQLVEKVQSYETELAEATTDAQKKEIEDRYTANMALLIKFNNDVKAENKAHAKAGLEAAKKQYDEDKILFDLQQKKLQDAQAEGLTDDTMYLQIKKEADELERLEGILVESKAQFMLFRKQAEDPTVSIFDPDEDGVAKGSKYWLDYTIPETIKWYKELIAHNKKLIESSTDVGKNLAWQEENIEYLEEIDRLMGIIDWDEFIDVDAMEDDVQILKDGIVALGKRFGLTSEQSQDLLDDYLLKYGETVDGILELYDLLDERMKMSEDLRIETMFLTLDLMEAISDGIHDKRIDNIDKEIDKNREYYDALIDAAQDNEDEQARLEREKEAREAELQKKKEREQKRAFLIQKGIEVATVIIQGALAASAAMAPPPVGLGPVLGATLIPQIALNTALQLGIIAAQTIPAFKDGVTNLSQDTKALINDGGVMEYVEREGKILTAKNMNAVVDLKRGDTVHKDESSLMNSKIYRDGLMAFNMSNNIINGAKNEVGGVNSLIGLDKKLQRGIRDGFKNVSLHSHTTIDAKWINFKNDTL